MRLWKKISNPWRCVFFDSAQTRIASRQNAIAYDELAPGIVQYLFNESAHPKKKKDDTDFRLSSGLQGGARLGLTKILGVKLDVNLGALEQSALTGKLYATENYVVSLDVMGATFGLDMSREIQIQSFTYGRDSINALLSTQSFDVKPAFQTRSISTKEFWKVDFGLSAGLGIKGTLDFNPLRGN